MNTPENPYAAPHAALEDVSSGLNTSGMGKDAVVPEEVKGWCWGGFLWGWIWGIGNGTFIALLNLIPWVGLVVQIYLGVKGRELAWRNKRWESVEHFNRVQRLWSLWWLGLVGGVIALAFLFAILSEF